MRGVHFADHLHDHVVQFFGVGDVGQQRLVLILGRGPIRAVHLGIVEAVLHDAPGFLENLPAFGRDVDLHAHGECDAARRGSAGRCRVAAAAVAPPPRPPGRRVRALVRPPVVVVVVPPRSDCQRVEAAALHEVDAAAVARPLRLGAAAESATTAAPSAPASSGGCIGGESC